MSADRPSLHPLSAFAAVAAASLLLFIAPVAAAPLALTVIPIDPPPAAAAERAGETIVPTVAPTAPSSLAGQSVQPDTAVLLWRDNSNNESGFVVEGRPADNPTFIPIGDPLPANLTSVRIVGLSNGITYVFRVRARNASGDSAATNAVTIIQLSNSDCQPSATVMCLNNNEFRVQALYLTSGGLSGEAQAVKLVADSGYLWFFASSNIEAVVKVLNGCTTNSHFWVFAGGLTDVRVLFTVTDTLAELSKSYSNPLGAAFQPIQDTSAFATCP